jgi:hypothetical protein
MADNTNETTVATTVETTSTAVESKEQTTTTENLINLSSTETETHDKNSNPDNLINVGGEETSDKTPETTGAPETYEAFTTPEGWELNESEHKTYSDLFRELNLTQAQAQKLVDAYNERTKTRIANNEATINQQITEWQESVRKSPTFERDANYVRTAIRAIKPDEAERMLIENRQFSNNPVIWGMFAKIGKLLSEDKIGGGGAVPTPKADENPYKININ